MPEDSGAEKAEFSRGPEPKYTQQEMKVVLNRFFDILCPVGLLFGGLSLLLSLFQSLQHGWYATSILHTAMYVFAILVLLLRRRLPERAVLGIFLGLMAVAAVHGLCTLGLASGGMMLFSLLCVFASVFFDIKGGLIGIIASVLTVIAIGTGICTGALTMRPNTFQTLSAPGTWMGHTFLFLLFTTALVLIINYMRKRITVGLHAVTMTNEQLQREISAKVLIENALRESESRYRNLVENTLVAFSIVQDGRFRFVNSRYCDITGYQYDELVDKLGPEDLAHPDHRPRVEEYCRRLLAGEPVSGDSELLVRRKDGTCITVKALGSLFNYLGKPAIFGSLIDITNEKVLESKLIQSQKMEAIGTLAGGIAHDFNNILSALIGFATMLHMGLEDKNPLKRYTTNILSASEKAAGLTQSLLTFSRSEPVELKSMKINTMINDTEDLLRRVISEDIDFRIDLSQEPINIRADAIQINQILFNLVANAMDAMPKGGRLEISTAIEDLDELFILRNGFGRKGRYCRITVADTGLGMDQATTNKIFNPFFTTKDAGKGTGLGLSTVYGIVKQHHGYIQVSSMPDEGTSFHIYFPAVSEASKVEKNPHRNFRKGHETILVAEDDTTTRCFIRDLLTYYGYNVIEAEDGKDALVKIQSHPDVSLLILDSIMPGKNGKEVYKAIREKLPDVRALFMSGYPREIVMSKGLLDPSMEFISKPLYPDKLMAKVGDLLDKGETESA